MEMTRLFQWLRMETSDMSKLLQVYLMVSNLENSRYFYENIIGLDPSKIGDKTCAYFIDGCELKLQTDFEPIALKAFNLDPPKEGHRGDGAVYVIRVNKNLSRLYEMMKEKIINSKGELVTEPRNVPWGESMCLVRDPDGYLIELRGNNN